MRIYYIRKRSFTGIILMLAAAVALSAGFFVAQGVFADSKIEEEPVNLPIIMYHSVYDSRRLAGKYVISPSVFREDMICLIEEGYTSISVSELIGYVYAGEELPSRPVMITLDDGCLNNYTCVLPILKELGIKAVISVVGEYTETFSESSDHNPEYAYLTWDDIRALSESGLVEIGNHTYFMHSISPRRGCMRMKGEGEDDYKSALINDIGRLQNELFVKSGVMPLVFTYPLGAISKEALPVIKKLGFLAAFNCYEKVNSITRNPETLYSLCRFNRPSGMTSRELLNMIDVKNG